MKKTLIAAAVMAASGVAFAASNVTLYGVIEEGLLLTKTKDKSAVVNLKSGMVSGNRWGLKGVEDLGNGYKVGFILEQGFSANNGEQAVYNKAFSRESILYVDGGFGSLAFGRTGGLAFAQSRAILTGWALGTSYDGAAWNAIDSVASRMNNVVSYATPAFGGFSVHAMYSNSGSNQYNDDSKKWSENGHYYGLGVKYQANAIKSSLIFEAAQNKNAFAPEYKDGNWNPTKTNSNKETKYGINYGLEWNLGAWTPMFAYQYIWQDGGNKDHQFGLSAKGWVAGGTVKLAARYTFGKNDGAAANVEDKHNTWLIGAAYDYPLSKRTTIKTYAGYADGGKAWKDESGAKYNGYQLYLGLGHTF